MIEPLLQCLYASQELHIAQKIKNESDLSLKTCALLTAMDPSRIMDQTTSPDHESFKLWTEINARFKNAADPWTV
jgi:hypothetical protein